MPKYIKASPTAARMMVKDLCGRTRTPDGSVLLWQADMLVLGPLTDMERNAARIGALLLTPEQAREEARGLVSRPLPAPTDPAFRTSDASDMSDMSDPSDPSDQSDN